MPHPRLTALLLTAAAALPVRADWKDDVGFTRLNQTFTSGVPTSLAAGLTQVEAPIDLNGSFMPDAANTELTGKTLNRFGTATTSSWHATEVGRFFYGSTSSLVPATSTIDVYHTSNWPLGSGETRGVQNHSWIAIYDPLNPPANGIEAEVAGINTQIDYFVNTRGFVCVVGVNNGSTSSTTLPDLLCQGYNNISVGLSNGNHSAGFTTRDGTGRIKPDIVAPDLYYTSYATPKVATAAALLTQKLISSYTIATADRPRIIKSLLLAGATKEEFPAWARTTTRPLDLRYGAGELNVQLAYQTLLAGNATASSNSLVPSTGWTVATSSGTQSYFFDLPSGSLNPRFSAALIWHRPVSKVGLSYNAGTLANLDLRLYNVNAGTFTLGSLVDSSLSTVDNLEHIYQPSLPPGRYALQVSATSGSAAYSLAWRTAPTVSVAATAPEARGADGTQGQFTLTRTGPTTTPLYVPITTGGTAVSGTHYTALPAAVLIPAGSSNATVQVIPAASPALQGNRTLTLSLATDFTLSAGTSANATVTIRDTTPPTVALSSNTTVLKAGQTAALTFTLSEPSTTFGASSITVSGGTLSAFSGSGSSYSATFNPAANSTAPGLVSVASSAFSDSAGNLNSDGAQPDNSIAFTIDTRPYEAWLTARFNSAQLADQAVSGPSADPDADGIANLLEYAFARDPLAPDSPSVLPSVTPGLDDRLSFTYFQAADRPDLLYIPEWTANPADPWQSSASYLAETSRVPVSGGESVTVRASTALTSAPLQFFRLRVSRQ